MKTLFTFLALPAIFLICFLSAKLYIAGEYLAAYALVVGWFVAFIVWIQHVALLFQRPVAAGPAAPRAYISGAKKR